jgi:simple sugar transport system ATP-binding protein
LEVAGVSGESCRLELRGITKVYPAVVANRAVNLSVRAGSIHAVLGENGAGKSTLMKIISGAVRADAGEMLWESERVSLHSPLQARRLGILMVYQHFSLFPALTVLDNLLLAIDNAGGRAALAERARLVSREHGIPVEPARYVHSLSVSERQQVEIVRCLLQSPRLLILDEPTSVLTPQAIEPLFGMLRRLADGGCSILYISHKLHEVRELCETATVLRQGRVVATVDPREESADSLARLMIGAAPPAVTRPSHGTENAVRLRVRDLSRPGEGDDGVALRQVAFSISGGEILGIAGIAGNGQAELLEALSGEKSGGVSGSVEIDGADVTRLGPQARRRHGLVYIPEERLGQGTVPSMSLGDNGLLTASHRALVRGGIIDRRAVRSFAERCIRDYDVRCGGVRAEARTLSGGNLQKFIVGRELSQTPAVVIAAQPTWGLDVGATAAIRKLLLSLRAQGAAILLVSQDLDELFDICDRLAVISHGRLSPISAVEETSIEEIGRWMGGDFTAGSPSSKGVERSRSLVLRQAQDEV